MPCAPAHTPRCSVRAPADVVTLGCQLVAAAGAERPAAEHPRVEGRGAPVVSQRGVRTRVPAAVISGPQGERDCVLRVAVGTGVRMGVRVQEGLAVLGGRLHAAP